jgi:hypothetical protein
MHVGSDFSADYFAFLSGDARFCFGLRPFIGGGHGICFGGIGDYFSTGLFICGIAVSGEVLMVFQGI